MTKLISNGKPANYAKAGTPAQAPTRAVKPQGLDPEVIEVVKLSLAMGQSPEAIGEAYGPLAGSVAMALAPTFNAAAPAEAPRALTPAEEIAKLRAENAALRKGTAKPRAESAISIKVSAKGALSVYGLGRFPVTLYRGQWERLLGQVEDIKAFIKANEARLAVKPGSEE